MKKILVLILGFSIGIQYATAQESGENNIKNVRFGLKTAGMLTWYKPDNAKKFENNGVSAKGCYGLMLEFRLNKVASIATGFQVDYFGGKLNMLDSNYYFLSKDSEFLKFADSTTGTTRYILNSRKYNTTYVTLPFSLKFKTPEIGTMTYFGQFGINASVKAKCRVDDEINNTKWTDNFDKIKTEGGATQTDLDNTSDMNLFMLALNVGGGVEMNLAGSTSILLGLNWYNGFSNVLKSDSKYLFGSPNNNNDAVKQDAKASAIALTVGILF